MPIKLSDLAAQTRQIDVAFGGETAQVVYRPNAVTPEFVARVGKGLPLLDAVCALVESWDVLAYDGAPVEVSAANLANVPMQFLQAVFNTIYLDAASPKAPKRA